MIQVREQIDIRRPPAEVYAVVADPRQDGRWNAPIEATRLTAPGPVAVGTTFEHDVVFLGRRFTTRAEVTALEEGRRACVRTLGGPLESAGCRLVEPTADGTRLTVTLDGRAGGPFRLVEGVAAVAARRQLTTALAALKALLEAEPA